MYNITLFYIKKSNIICLPRRLLREFLLYFIHLHTCTYWFSLSQCTLYLLLQQSWRFIKTHSHLLIFASLQFFKRASYLNSPVTFLLQGADGIPFGFLNGLEISKNGTVFFTDSSSKWGRRHVRYEVSEGHQNTSCFVQWSENMKA